MNYENLKVGDSLSLKECKDLLGEELTFTQLVKHPATEKLIFLMESLASGELEEEDTFHVGQITRVVDDEEGYEEYASVIVDLPGFSDKPICVEDDDMEAPKLDEDDDPHAIINCYIRVWKVKKPLPQLERLAIGALIYSKCKANYIDTTQDLVDSLSSGLAATIFNASQIKQIRTVLGNAKIEIPEKAKAAPSENTSAREEAQAAPAEAEAAPLETLPAEIIQDDSLAKARALHQRIMSDAQTAAESLWDMCKAIKEMRDGKHYKALLYANFEAYCENALGMSRAQGYRYIQIAEGMNPESVAALQQIGTTKLALLASVTDDQREIVTAAVDVESATVKELQAEIDRLKGKVSKAEQEKHAAENMQSVERAQRKESDAAFERAQNRIKELVAEKQQQADRKELLDAADNQIRRLNAELANNSDYIGKLQKRITELENRPVEVAVQEDSEALEQLRQEYEVKLAAKDDEAHFIRLDTDFRETRIKVQSLCTMIGNMPDGKKKETMIQNIRGMIRDIEQRIGKE